MSDDLTGLAAYDQQRHPMSTPEEQAAKIRTLTLRQLQDAPKEWFRGIDVSHYQGAIDWAKVNASVEWVAIKATEGAHIVDSRFTSYWMGANKVGLRRGAYLFYRPNEDIQAQADLFCKTVAEPFADELLPIIDLERATPDAPAKEDNDKLLKLISILKSRYGKPPILYTSARYCHEEGVTVGGECPLWVVWYQSGRPKCPVQWDTWALWQMGYAPGVPGIAGDVDRDVCQVKIETLTIGGV